MAITQTFMGLNMMFAKKHALLVVFCTFCCVGHAAEDQADNAANPLKRGKLDVLAEHHVIARFDGAPYRLCRGLTARCPQGCGDSGEFAKFTVLKYVEFKKHGKYGAKRPTYPIQISDFDRKPKGDPKVTKLVKSLKVGDKVVLKWEHLYGEVTPNSFSPRHPLVELRKATAEEAVR
jgi:hypothetical protein